MEEEFNIDNWQPYHSHEFIADIMDYTALEGRGFVVGCHGENISTTYNHRYRGRILTPKETEEILIKTNTLSAPPAKFKPSPKLRLRRIVNKLPFHGIIKKLYYALPICLRRF